MNLSSENAFANGDYVKLVGADPDAAHTQT